MCLQGISGKIYRIRCGVINPYSHLSTLFAAKAFLAITIYRIFEIAIYIYSPEKLLF